MSAPQKLIAKLFPCASKWSSWRSSRTSLFLVGLFLAGTFRTAAAAEPTAKGSEADLIRQELRALKLEHEQRMRALEDRLLQLESAAATPEKTPNLPTPMETPPAAAAVAATPAETSALAVATEARPQVSFDFGKIAQHLLHAVRVRVALMQ